MRGKTALDHILSRHVSTIQRVLDVGCGALQQAEYLASHGKEVVALDTGRSIYSERAPQSIPRGITVLEADFTKPELWAKNLGLFGLVWCCHTLEHLPDVGIALTRMRDLLKLTGLLAIVVPAYKPDLVGGHLSLWTQQLLAYRLILAGFDCSEAAFCETQYEISAVVCKYPRVPLNVLSSVTNDFGDIALLSRYFPHSWNVYEGIVSVPSCTPGW